MPRATKNASIGRAALAAPYPLPIIVTRSHTHAAPAPAPAAAPPAPEQASDAQPQESSSGSGSGFPAAKHNWREAPPAFPPIPYPARDRTQPRRRKCSWRIKLQGMIMSGLPDDTPGTDLEVNAEPDGPDMELIKRFGDWTLADEKEKNTSVTTNLLQAAFQTVIPAAYTELDHNYYPFTVPHLAGAAHAGATAGASGGLLPPLTLDAPITPYTPGNIGAMAPPYVESSDADDSEYMPGDTDISSWISGAEDEDLTPHASPRSVALETPQTSRPGHQLLSGSTTGYLPLPGQGQQYPASSLLRPTAAGYESDASSVETTITRIPRSKFSRERRHMYTSKGYVRRNPPRAAGNNDAVPAVFELSRPFHTNFDSGFHIGFDFPRSFATRHSGERALALPPITEEVESEAVRAWSPQPMSIDPRSATRSAVDWPTTMSTSTSTAALPLPLHIGHERRRRDRDRDLDRDLRQYSSALSPVHGFTRGLRLPSAPAHRNAPFPIDKACHNFLLAHKVHALRRRESMMRRAQQLMLVAQQEYSFAQNMMIEPSPMDIDEREGYFAMQQDERLGRVNHFDDAIAASTRTPSARRASQGRSDSHGQSSVQAHARAAAPPRKRARIESESEIDIEPPSHASRTPHMAHTPHRPHTSHTSHTSPLTGLTRSEESQLGPYYLPHGSPRQTAQTASAPLPSARRAAAPAPAPAPAVGSAVGTRQPPQQAGAASGPAHGRRRRGDNPQSTYELMLAIAERKEDEARLLREMVLEQGDAGPGPSSVPDKPSQRSKRRKQSRGCSTRMSMSLDLPDAYPPQTDAPSPAHPHPHPHPHDHARAQAQANEKRIKSHRLQH